MNELIKITPQRLGNEEVNCVSGTDLHGFLDVKTQFKNWIVRRIEEYGFIEEMDFRSFLTESTGGRPAKEYMITINMAKELAMVEKTEKGRMARRYFIECETRLKAISDHKALPEKRSQHQYFAVAAMCKQLDKHLGGLATARALEYFTGMPTQDLVEKIEARMNRTSGLSVANMVDRFLADQCVFANDASETATVLFSSFNSWFKERFPTMRPLNQKQFGSEMSRRFSKEKTGGRYVYSGVGLF